MPLMQLANGNLTTTSVNNQLTTDVTITPASTVGFPGQPQFTILERQSGEIMLVTAVNAGPTWTVTRGFGGTTAHAITAGDNLDYSVTREMLLAGFMAKLDEQTLAADTPNGIITLTVPSNLAFLRNLEFHWQGGATTDAFLQWRFNNDSSALYDFHYAFFGSSSSSNRLVAQTFGRAWAGNPAGGLPNIGADLIIRIGNADATDRWKTWNGQQFLRQSAADSFVMIHSGVWRPTVQAAISTIQISADSAQNGTYAAGTLRAGSRATLYGLP